MFSVVFYLLTSIITLAMRSMLTLLLSVVLLTTVLGQDVLYHRVKVDLTDTPIVKLASLGIEVDHGVVLPGIHLVNDLSTDDIAKLIGADIPFEVLIKDMSTYYADRASSVPSQEHGHDHTLRTAALDCRPIDDELLSYQTPANYQYGTMGGYLTYEDAIVELTKMHALYPDLITPLLPISDFRTEEGRPIYYLRLSDNPDLDETTEPEVLYTSLHHAREPNSLAQNLFFMWYLLENYESDPEVQYLVNNTELYFIPIVNPDGYAYNSTDQSTGGGLWRKNRAVIDGQVVGVDLNRNYGYQWGFDDIGSSTSLFSATYRGPSAFSEPETRAVQWLCEQHRFRLALNYHTFGNLLIYPWGYNDQPTPDDVLYKGISDILTSANRYVAGTGTETVGYVTNGDSDDYMYGEQTDKLKIYSFTPEVGSGFDGFWPSPDRIDYLNKSSMKQNLSLAHLTKNYAEATVLAPKVVEINVPFSIDTELTRYGFASDAVTFSIYAVETDFISPVTVLLTLDQLEVYSRVVDGLIGEAGVYSYVVEVDMGDYVVADTMQVIAYDDAGLVVSTVLEDDYSSTDQVFSRDWDLTSQDFVSVPTALASHPDGDYPPNVVSEMTVDEIIDLSKATEATLTFWFKQDVEEDYDYVQVRASVDGGATWSPLCGQYTEDGVPDQVAGEPLYDGVDDWRLESIDLDDFLGIDEVVLGFVLVSDGGIEGEGFLLDDLRVEITSAALVDADRIDTEGLFVALYPNPAVDRLYLDTNADSDIDYLVTDVLGRAMARGEYSLGSFIDISVLAAGIYQCTILDRTSYGQIETVRFVKR